MPIDRPARRMTLRQLLTHSEKCSRDLVEHFQTTLLPNISDFRDLSRPDFGDPVEVRPGEIPVFWACGVTPQTVAMEVRPPLLLTHKPGHMFVTDLRDADLEGG